MDDDLELLTVAEVAKILSCKLQTVYSLRGLKRVRVGNGRGIIRFKKKDVISYINSGVEEIDHDENKKTQRNRQVGVSTLLPWEELQKIRMEYER